MRGWNRFRPRRRAPATFKVSVNFDTSQSKPGRHGYVAIMTAQFQTGEEWRPISTEPAPFLSDLELAVVDYDGPHALVFPCRRVSAGWVKSETRELVDVRPTHWRHWQP
jgi:hypothetical protein